MDEQDFTNLHLIKVGDKEALANLYERYSKIVYSVALRTLRNPSCAEDVLQEVFLQIWRTPDQFIGASGDMSCWLAVTARNRAIDFIRRRRPSLQLTDVVLASEDDVAYHSEKHLMCERAKFLMGKLPVEQQTAMKLAFFSDMSHVEIAESTGCPLGTIKTRIRTAIKTLRKGLDVQAVKAKTRLYSRPSTAALLVSHT